MTNPRDYILSSTSELIKGAFIPIQTLKSLAMQKLVLLNSTIDELLLGEGYRAEAKSVSLLTTDCVGEYFMTELDESVIFGDRTEGTEEDKAEFRDEELTTGVVQVQVVKINNHTKWRVGELVSYCPGGCLRQRDFEEIGGYGVTKHEWIEGTSLVKHTLVACHPWEKECNDSEEGGDEEKSNSRLDIRVVVTFCHDMLLYQEKVECTKKCKCNNCSYIYRATAWFIKK